MDHLPVNSTENLRPQEVHVRKQPKHPPPVGRNGSRAAPAVGAPPNQPAPCPDTSPYAGPRAETIAAEIARLSRMGVAELREKHRELYGTETRSKHRQQLFRKLAWRLQEIEWGGLSDRAKRRIEELADDRDAHFLPPRAPNPGGNGNVHREVVAFVPRTSGDAVLLPGTVLVREHRGEEHRVTVLERGFEHRGKVYRSLSAIAREVTGTNWNGHLWFGLRQRPARQGRPK
jgi:hypothetical protein